MTWRSPSATWCCRCRPSSCALTWRPTARANLHWRPATVLNLLDAAHIEDGPVAQAQWPYVLPLAFHGNFTAL